jgi:phosphoglycerate dehydrogenase-like enzyme
MRVAILDDYQGVALAMAEWSAVAARADIAVFRGAFADADAAAAALAPFDIVCAMRERTPFPAALLSRLPKLKCLVTTGMGNAAIDLAAARQRGIAVCGTSHGPGQAATAELAFGLMLAASRGLTVEDREARAGHWQTRLGTMLRGKTLGIVGLGHVGRHMAGYAAAFGMTVLAWSRTLTEARAAESGARCVPLDALLAGADFVSLHLALNEGTRGLIGRRELALMRPHAFLINTARGPVVDEAALIEALAGGRLAGAALDVFDREPLPAAHPFRAMPDKVILSPHIGYVTREVYEVFYRDTAEAVLAFLNGAPVRRL